jgi:hypothetical protein
MGLSNSQRVVFQDELSAAMTGSLVEIGTLVDDAIWITFDNTSTTDSVAIHVNGNSNPWRTFPAGEAIVVDVDTNRGNAPGRTFPKGTVFSGNGASGTFYISYLTTRN